MAILQEKKASPIMVLRILQDYSDENHPLTQQNIIDRIDERYGIELERKSIGSTIELLQELDIEIGRGLRGGYYLISREFEKSEITYLIDGIFSSRFIPAHQAEDLANRLSNTLSIYDRKSYDFIRSSSELSRVPNKEIFHTIDAISEARQQHKQISFSYYTYDREGNQVEKYPGYKYRVSPYYLVNNLGSYYLLCHTKNKDDLSIYRLDYMKNVSVLNDYELEDRSDFDTLKDFNIIDFLNEHVYVFNDEVIDATLEIKDEPSIHCVYDWFGNKAQIFNKDDKIFAKVRCNEQSLMYWCLQYCDCVRAISPESFRKRVEKTLQDALQKYKEQ
ncbi:MAG: WYL domain-containing protein [Coprobacillus sp.]|nr:WYL domain-containing protein [Coprobacillus sp.]